MKKFAEESENIKFFEHLGADCYYSVMQKATLMIGNSSSGIWEAPSFKLPVVNIGSRQDARVRAINVLDAELKKDSIMSSIQRALSQEFRASLVNCTNPYVNEQTNSLIVDDLLIGRSKEKLLFKKYVDPLLTAKYYKKG